MATLIETYETYRRGNRRIRATSTDKAYRIALRQFAQAIGHTPTIEDLSDQNLISLERWLEGRSAFTINDRTSRLKALWRWCAQQGLTATWPSLDRLETDDPVRDAWSVDEVRRLLTACTRFPGAYSGVPASRWWYVWHLVQWETGERTGAMRALRWDMLSDRGLSIPGNCRKGRKAAFYRLSAATMQHLGTIRNPCRDLIFPFEYHPASFYNHYRRLLQSAELPTGRKSKPQRMRRTHLTYWAVGGGDPTARAQHTSRAVTDRFYLDQRLLDQPDPNTILPSLMKVQ